MPVVEIYTKTFCSYCWRAKMLLESKGVAFKEISVDFGGEPREQMIQRGPTAARPCRKSSSVKPMSAAAMSWWRLSRRASSTR